MQISFLPLCRFAGIVMLVSLPVQAAPGPVAPGEKPVPAEHPGLPEALGPLPEAPKVSDTTLLVNPSERVLDPPPGTGLDLKKTQEGNSFAETDRTLKPEGVKLRRHKIREEMERVRRKEIEHRGTGETARSRQPAAPHSKKKQKKSHGPESAEPAPDNLRQRIHTLEKALHESRRREKALRQALRVLLDEDDGPPPDASPRPDFPGHPPGAAPGPHPPFPPMPPAPRKP